MLPPHTTSCSRGSCSTPLGSIKPAVALLCFSMLGLLRSALPATTTLMPVTLVHVPSGGDMSLLEAVALISNYKTSHIHCSTKAHTIHASHWVGEPPWKKYWIESYEAEPRTAGVIPSSLAVCHAHYLSDHRISASWKNGIVVLDWGASSLTATTFSTHGSMLSQNSTTSKPFVSGTQLSMLLMKHGTETVSCKHRLPKDGVLLNGNPRQS